MFGCRPTGQCRNLQTVLSAVLDILYKPVLGTLTFFILEIQATLFNLVIVLRIVDDKARLMPYIDFD